MTSAQKAAFRLRCLFAEQGKVRTNAWQPPQAKTIRGRKRIVTGLGRGGNNRQAVRIGRKTYATRKDAMAQLHIGTRTLRAMLADGRARRV